MKKVFNSNLLKLIAILSMLLDHMAYLFFNNTSILYYVFRIIGRVCAPIMFYGIAKGYKYSSNKFKYGLRLFIFACLSQIPYSLFINNKLFVIYDYNVIFTLFLAFISIVIMDKCKHFLVKGSLLFLCLFLSLFCDWGVIGIVISLIFYLITNDLARCLLYSLACVFYSILKFLIYHNTSIFLFGLGMCLALIFILLDNNKKGKYNLKYMFYCFYPLHFLVLYFIYLFI